MPSLPTVGRPLSRALCFLPSAWWLAPLASSGQYWISAESVCKFHLLVPAAPVLGQTQVSVSVGDSMTFFFRRLPPIHRRKSGVMVRIDDPEADLQSALGDSAHNQ